jgi:hypothetical protein
MRSCTRIMALNLLILEDVSVVKVIFCLSFMAASIVLCPLDLLIVELQFVLM